MASNINKQTVNARLDQRMPVFDTVQTMRKFNPDERRFLTLEVSLEERIREAYK